MEANKKIKPIVSELFMRGKLSISVVFFYHNLICSDQNKRDTSFYHENINKKPLQQIAFNPSSDIEFNHLVKFYKDHDRESFPFLVNDTTLASDSPLKFRKNLLRNDC